MTVLAQSDLQIWYKFESGDVDPSTKVIKNHVSSPAAYVTGSANANSCPITTLHNKRGSGSIDLTLGDDNTFINLPSIDFSQLTEWTISMWYKMPANNTSDSFKDIISLFESANAWGSALFNEISYGSTSIRIGLNGYPDINTGVNLYADNIWHHYCITYSNGTATYYFDTNNFYTKFNTTFTTNTTTNFIGRNPSNTPSQTGISSYIDDFRFYSTALTSSQVSELYNVDDDPVITEEDTRSYNMPQKDITSINEGSFSQRRNVFSAFARTDEKKTIEVVKQKKFYGGSNNRDASSITTKRAVQGHNSSFALNGQSVFFQGTKTTQDTRQALKRVRNGGSVVPAKKTHQHNNAPRFY